MTPMLRLAISALALVIVVHASSFAWSNVGHMTVAYVAYQKLTPAIRSRVDALVRLNPYYNKWRSLIPPGTSAANTNMMMFVIAATWPDQIKSDSSYYSDGSEGGNVPPADGTAARNIGYSDRALHKYWHFIDVPFSTDGTQLQPPTAPNAKTQISAFRLVLASHSSDSLKSYDLVWLLHMVGDIHQPMHCTTRFTQALPSGDAGGNLVKVCVPPCGTPLHSYWDELFGTQLDPTLAATVAASLPQASASKANDLNPATWVTESFNMARTKVYASPVGNGSGQVTLTAKYKAAALVAARERVALGGARLANILNRELK